MRRLPPLNALRAFEATARHLSFKQAADELVLTPSALSHQVKGLEDYLGLPLFVRQTRSIALTEKGAQLLPYLTEGFDRLADGIRRLGAETPDNVLIVSTGPAFAAKWLAPRVYRFVDLHPDIELRISANLKKSDFQEDGVDVVVRFGNGDYPGLFTEKLFDDYVIPLVSPHTVTEDRPLNTPADLAHHTLLHDESMAFMNEPVGWAEWLRHAGVSGIDAERGPRFNHADHGIDAAVDGAGVVLGRTLLARRDIRLGHLVAPFDLRLPTGAAYWFCCPPPALEREKIRVFKDWLMTEVVATNEDATV